MLVADSTPRVPDRSRETPPKYRSTPRRVISPTDQSGARESRSTPLRSCVLSVMRPLRRRLGTPVLDADDPAEAEVLGAPGTVEVVVSVAAGFAVLVAATAGALGLLSLPPCVVAMTVMRVVMIASAPPVSQKYRMPWAPCALAPGWLSAESASCGGGCVTSA